MHPPGTHPRARAHAARPQQLSACTAAPGVPAPAHRPAHPRDAGRSGGGGRKSGGSSRWLASGCAAPVRDLGAHQHAAGHGAAGATTSLLSCCHPRRASQRRLLARRGWCSRPGASSNAACNAACSAACNTARNAPCNAACQAETVLLSYYQLQRRQEGRSEARTTIRMLESLVRLAQVRPPACLHVQHRPACPPEPVCASAAARGRTADVAPPPPRRTRARVWRGRGRPC
jgi:hypothetical protein